MNCLIRGRVLCGLLSATAAFGLQGCRDRSVMSEPARQQSGNGGSGPVGAAPANDSHQLDLTVHQPAAEFHPSTLPDNSPLSAEQIDPSGHILPADQASGTGGSGTLDENNRDAGGSGLAPNSGSGGAGFDGFGSEGTPPGPATVP